MAIRLHIDNKRYDKEKETKKVSVVFLPITTRIIGKLKAHEGEDVYDRDISYGIFDIFKRSA